MAALKYAIAILSIACVLVPTNLRAADPSDLLGSWTGEWVGHRGFRRGFLVEIISIDTTSNPLKVKANYCWELARAKEPVPGDKAGCLPAEGTLKTKKMFMVLHYGKKHQVRMDFRKHYAVWWGQSYMSGDFKRIEQREAAVQ